MVLVVWLEARDSRLLGIVCKRCIVINKRWGIASERKWSVNAHVRYYVGLRLWGELLLRVVLSITMDMACWFEVGTP